VEQAMFVTVFVFGSLIQFFMIDDHGSVFFREVSVPPTVELRIRCRLSCRTQFLALEGAFSGRNVAGHERRMHITSIFH
jgi:hypothetical protein